LTNGSVYFDNKVTLSSADNTAFCGLGTPVGQSYDYVVYDVAWSQDGRYLAVVEDEGLKVYLFNGYSMMLIDSIAYGFFALGVGKVAWNPDGQYLAVVGINSVGHQTVEVYSFNGFSLTLAGGASYFVASSVAWSPNGKYLAVGGNSWENDLSVYEWDGTSLTFKDGVHYGEWSETWYSDIYSIKWNPDGSYLAMGGIYPNLGHTELEVYSFDGTSLTITASQHYGPWGYASLNAVAWNPTGEYLAIGGTGASYPNTDCLQMYHFDSSSLRFVTSYGVENCESVAWSPDGSVVGIGSNLVGEQLQIFSFTGSSLNLLATANYGDDDGTIYGIDWNPAGTFLAIGDMPGWSSVREKIEVYPVVYRYNTLPQAFNTGISFGNSAIDASQDLAVHSLAANRINLYGKLWHDSLNSWTFDSRDSYLSLNRYDSKFKITSADSMNNWKKQHIIKASEDNTIFLQDNQVWEANTDYNLAPLETFEFMNDLIIPDNQQVKFSSNAVIDGQGHSIILGEYAQLLVDNQTTVTFKNMMIRNKLNSTDIPPLVCRGADSTICLDDVTLGLSDDYTFTIGRIFFHDKVEFTGTTTFSYKSTQTSYIAEHTNLIFGPNTTFVYDPQSINQQLFSMKDKTSAMLFDGSSLKVTQTGIRLTRGSVFFDNKVELNSTIGRMLGLFPLASAAWTEVDSVNWSPDGRFLAIGTAGGGTSLVIYEWDGSTLVQKDSKSLGSVVYSVAWSPNGQFLAVGRGDSPRLLVYEWNGSTLTEKDSKSIGNNVVLSVAWNSNGQYLAAATSWTGNNLYIYEWNGSVLTEKAAWASGTFNDAVAWSPTEQTLAVGGGNLYVFTWNGTTLTQKDDEWGVNVRYLDWSPDGNVLAANGDNLYIYTWDGSTLTQQDTRSGDGRGISWSPNGKYLAAGRSGVPASLTIYDWDGVLLTEKISEGFGSYILGLHWRFDGSYLAAGGGNGATDLIVYGTGIPDTYSNGIIFGNSVLGSAYDLDVNVLAGACVTIAGYCFYDNVS